MKRCFNLFITTVLFLLPVMGNAMNLSGYCDALLKNAATQYPAGAASSAYYRNCYQLADKQLNQIYRRIVRYIKTEAVTENKYLSTDDAKNWVHHFRNAQRAWIKFKEIECNQAAPYLMAGGSGAGDAAPACLAEITLLRSQKLKRDFSSLF